jgi:hypothetical protein
MKTLIVTSDKNKLQFYNHFFLTYFPSLSPVHTSGLDQTVQVLSYDGPFGFFLVDAQNDDSDYELDELLSSLIDLSGELPIIIFGQDEDLTKVDKTTLLKKQNNILLRYDESPDHLESTKSTIDTALKWSEEQNFENCDADEDMSNYIPMRVRNLFFYNQFPHNLFIQISAEKMNMAFEKDTKIFSAQISKLIKRKIKFVYINKDDHINFLEISMRKGKKFLDTRPEFSKKLIIAHMRSTALLQDYLSNIGITPSVKLFIEALVEQIIATASKITTFKGLIKYYDIKIESVVSKSLICAYASFYMIQEMGWSSDTTRKKFIVASLIQDTFVGADELAQLSTLQDPSIINFTEDQIKDFPYHPTKIAELAAQLSHYPDIDFILSAHHERPKRDGFPNRPTPTELQVAACLFSIASQFSRDIDGNEFTPEVFNRIYKSYAVDYNIGNFKLPLKSLAKILNIKA